MRIWPQSLFARLLGIGILSTLGALLFAGFAIGHVLERFVLRGLDERLDTQIALLVRAIGPDGALRPAQVVNLPGFGEAGSGWAWRVDAPAGHWASETGAGVPAIVSAGPPPENGPSERHLDRRDGPARSPPPGLPPGTMPGEARGHDGEGLHARTITVESPAGPATITAIGPRRIIAAPIREAMTPLLLALGLLGAGLVLATLVQLRVGLKPLRALATALADVRAGRRSDVPTGQPRELAPLATELNALIAQNEAGLAHARNHVANLAHGLKTPLAALALNLAEGDRDPDGSLGQMVAQIDRRVRHHLGRARAAAPGGGGRTRTLLAPAIADLAAVLRRIHAERAIVMHADIPDDLAVAVDPQDLDEMLGNLLDNAWRHAGAAIRITASRAGAMVTIAIEDDGPGLGDTAMAEAMLPGRRLDERGDGHGFGLPIARELAELNGGTLRLARRDGAPGLRVEIGLPA